LRTGTPAETCKLIEAPAPVPAELLAVTV
jgi:hypothetical protein